MEDTSRPGASHSAPGAPPTAPRVAVVDDDADIRDLLTDLLVYDGFQVVAYSDRDTATTALAAELPALLITDARLRGADGFDLLRSLAESGRSLPPILLLTAAAPESYSMHTALLTRVGAHVLRKPFDVDQLLQLARALTGWPGVS
jgi:DNA-binding response OmpR family regulator